MIYCLEHDSFWQKNFSAYVLCNNSLFTDLLFIICRVYTQEIYVDLPFEERDYNKKKENQGRKQSYRKIQMHICQSVFHSTEYSLLIGFSLE